MNKRICISIVAGIVLMAPGCQEGKMSFRRQRPDVHRHYIRAQTLMDQGDLEQAVVQLQKVLQGDPRHARALADMADIHRKRGEYPQALNRYQQACRSDSYAFLPHYNMGVTCQALAERAQSPQEEQDYLNQGAKAFARAAEIKPDSFDSWLNLSACQFALGRGSKALQSTQAALEIQPESIQALNNMGTICQGLRQYPQAIAAYRASLQYQPDQNGILNELGNIYMATEDFGSALSIFSMIARKAPSSASPWKQIGNCYYRMKEMDKARRSYQEAIQRDPNSADSYRALGVACMSQYVLSPTQTDLRTQALQSWYQSLTIEPNQPELRRMYQEFSAQATPVR